MSTRTHWVTQGCYSTLCNILYQKRTWKRRYIHLHTSESSCCRSKKRKENTHNLIIQLHTAIQTGEWKYKTGIRKADSCPQATVTQMVSHPWNLSWRDSSWREPKTRGAQCRGAGSMWQEMWPHDGPGLPPALCMSPQSPDAGGTSCRETKPTSPKNWWNL